MYQLDFASVVIGYIVGVLLCYSNMYILFAQDDIQEDNPVPKSVPKPFSQLNNYSADKSALGEYSSWEVYKKRGKDNLQQE